MDLQALQHYFEKLYVLEKMSLSIFTKKIDGNEMLTWGFKRDQWS